MDGSTDVLPSGVKASRAHTVQKSRIPDLNKWAVSIKLQQSLLNIHILEDSIAPPFPC